MENCIFCKIINKEIPCYKIYEDENTLAFLDISKDAYGHTLVIPKTHSRNILDAKEEDMLAVIKTVQKVSNHYINFCGFDGVNILNNNEESADQSIFHLHIHIIPRKNNDELKIFPSLSKKDIDLETVKNKLEIK